MVSEALVGLIRSVVLLWMSRRRYVAIRTVSSLEIRLWQGLRMELDAQRIRLPAMIGALLYS
jgi:hypothetical protein